MQSIHIPFKEHFFNESERADIFAGQGRVFKCLLGDETVYVKKSERTKRHFWHVLQGGLYKVFKDPLLIPTVLGKDEDDIQFQVDKMRRLKKNGIKVPDVVFVDKGYFIMSDCGECVKEYLKLNPRQTDLVLNKACREMAKLHLKNFVHGGAQIKNFVVRQGVVSLIDFEEKIDTKFIEAFKVRDMLVFLLSLERGGFQTDIKRLCQVYHDITHKDIYADLKKFFKKYKWISFLNHKIFDFLSMKDVRAFLNLMNRFDG